MKNEVDITIKKLNETYIKVECREVYMEMELSERFSFKVADAKFDPRVKAGRWDGIKRLYNRTYKRMYTGLLFELLKFIRAKDYSYTIDPDLIPKTSIDIEDIRDVTREFIKPHDNKKAIEPYDYQYEAVHYMLNSNRSICLAATSAGKSLSIYLAIRMYQVSDDFDGKQILIIVPSKMLVEQLYADFENYSTFEGSNWHASTFCQKVSGKYSKFITKPVVITTWQSLKNMPAEIIANAGAIFVDEVHTVKGPVLASLLEAAVACSIRHGLTGTLDDMESNQMAAQGLLGPSKRIVTAKEIIDAGRATNVVMNCILLDYDNDTKRAFHNDQRNVPDGSAPGAKYQAEISFINNLKSRFDLIQKLVLSLKGNTIILFDRVEEYGIPLYEDMLSKHENTFLISGNVDGDERESIRTNLESYYDAKVYATSSIMSTGVSIKNLHNMVFVSSSKSKIRVLQSIGRLMRLHESKSVANLYDLVDKLDYNGKQNATLKHVEERIKFYSAEKYKVKFVTVTPK
jgi:superfamily II DNA or RNA helicase